MKHNGVWFLAMVLVLGCSSSSSSDKGLDGGKDTGTPDTGDDGPPDTGKDTGMPDTGDGGAFQCTGVPANGCSAAQLGLSCVIDPGDALDAGAVAINCECLPADGGQDWKCGISSPCPGTPPQSGTECASGDVSTIAALGGCKYGGGIRTICSCHAADGGEVWSCANAP